ncbi:tyrosine-type recombinase/integrase [Alkaliphilus metalliredigens]|uniref:tyrosine-type recombinase/integrase n=1 Tax=Alkaliphilus metalliredigens TaxID=208226 RepID=UPI00005CD158|nr:phage integrase N-terminal SAM-like domain-containing protein [Alkaliphilus metalliredigens]
MRKEEAVVRIVGRLDLEFNGMLDQQKARQIIQEVLYDYDVNPAQRSLVVQDDMNDKILLYLASKKIDGLAMRTLEGYSRNLNRFAYYMRKNVEDVTTMDIRMYLASYAKTGVKNGTIGTETDILRGFFRWLEDEEYINKSPLRKIKSLKPEKRIRKALTNEEMEILRDGCKTYRQKALLEFFL